MGNAVACGLDVESLKEAYKRRQRRRSRSLSSRDISDTSSASSRSGTNERLNSGDSSGDDDAAGPLRKPQSAAYTRPSFNTNRQPSPQRGPNGARSALRSLKASDPDRHLPPATARCNRKTTTSAPPRPSSVLEHSLRSNEMSFSVPEIDFHNSSPTESTDRVSTNEESYSFGLQASIGGYRVSEGRASPLRGSFPDAVPGAKKTSVATDIVNDFAAWDMGLGTMNDVQRASPAGNTAVATTKPSSGERLPMLGQPRRTSKGVNTTTTATLAGPSQIRGGTTASPATRRSADATAGTSVKKPSTMLDKRGTGQSTRMPVISSRYGVVSTWNAAAPPQKTFVATLQHTQQIPSHVGPRAAPNTARLGKVNAPASKLDNEAVKPKKNGAEFAAQNDEVEPYDLRFFSRAASPQEVETKDSAVAAMASAPLPNSRDQGKTGGDSSVPSTTKIAAASLATHNKVEKEEVRGVERLVATHSEERRLGGSHRRSKSRGSRAVNAAAAAAAVASKSPKDALTQTNAPTPGVASATGRLNNESKAGKSLVDAAPALASSSSSSASSSSAHTEKGVNGAHAGSASPAFSTSEKASSRQKVRSFTPNDDDRSSPLQRSESGVASRPHHHHRREDERDSTKMNAKDRVYLDDDEDDEDDDDSDEEEETPSGDDLENSVADLRPMKRVDSILVKNSSFRSRTGSVGPQDITPATGSVSFLLGEKEAELALASSQLMSRAIPRRRREQVRQMSKDFGVGVLRDVEGDAQGAAPLDNRAASS
ncbi:hypothetical protein ABB37_05848 [Leptomonas pyrrhocoris]|uniref:Uncharacterized protein n=1 Tax=Leptomonas pyrrhocoris TaxID=157538 RepID=A0A0M9FYU3_LEPPY|nr:hypothetical protein ABB37_05848 [Leptomonas pyrrhocoris]KPA78719.1 hypothetical protein ABB37_05848 [Leptomonas pyrrhocoris]|eukprot:XP_015657158.1 hypothetical protein ABB37_05848 [Leptomonas pyrrhocoris]